MILECSAFGAASKSARSRAESSKPAIAVYIEDMTEDEKIPVSMIKERMSGELSKLGTFNVLRRDDDVSIGKIRAANFIMIGAVTFCYYNQQASGYVIPFLGIETKAKTAYVVFSIRIVDVSTSSIVYASTHAGEAANKNNSRVNSLTNELIAQAASNAVDKSISAMKNHTWLNTPSRTKKSNTRAVRAGGGASSRPTLTLLDFLYKGETGEIFPSALLGNVMMTKLHELGGFELLEFAHRGYIAAELKLVQSGLADRSTAPEVGKIKSPQYILTGAMTFYYSKKASSAAVPELGIATKAETAYTKLETRIIDVTTAKIVFVSAQIGENTNRGIVNHNDMTAPSFWKAATNAMEQSISEIKALAWLNIEQNTPSRPKPSAPKTDNANAPANKGTTEQGNNNINEMFSESSILDLPRVVIGKFEDQTEDRNAPIASIKRMMVTELRKAGIFILIDRDDDNINLITDELERAESGFIESSTAPKRGNLWGYQYIIKGAVTLRKYDEKGSGFMLPIIGTASKAKTAYVVLDIQITDAKTFKIIYADDQVGSATNKEKTTITSYENMVGGLLDMAARDAVKKHVSELKTQTSRILQ